MMTEIKEYKLSYGQVKVILHSQIGSFHIKNSLPNQDCYSVIGNHERVIIAVADGVSSCCNADNGSKAAVMAANQLLSIEKLSDETIKQTILEYWQANINYPATDCCSTLHFIIVCSDKIILGGIGDGMQYCLTDNFFEKMYDDSGFANCTYALPMKDHFIIRYIESPRSSLIALITDGISNEMDESLDIEFGHYLKESLKNIVGLKEEVEKWVLELQEKNGDDKTIAIVSFEREHKEG